MPDAPEDKPDATYGNPRLARVRDHLMQQPKADLVALLIELAAWDNGLRDRLLMEAATTGTTTSTPPDVTEIKTAIDRLTDVPRRTGLGWREAPAFCRRVDDAAEQVERLLRAGHAAAALDVTEHFLVQLNEAVLHVNDDSGDTGRAISRLETIHVEACRQTSPDPEALAERLFRRRLHHDAFGLLDEIPTKYREVLGERGLAVYRRLVQAQWDRLPALGPGQKDDSGSGDRITITDMMLELAAGDVDQVMEVLKKNLSETWHFQKIAETLRDGGRHDEAVSWIERAKAAFSDSRDYRLDAFLIEDLHRRGHHEKATERRWRSFEAAPSASSCRSLKEAAVKAGSWTEMKPKALELLRQAAASEKKQKIGSPGGKGRSDLVEILIEEGDVEGAWMEAMEGGAHDGLLAQLVELRHERDPAGCAEVLVQLIEGDIDPRNRESYPDIARKLAEAKEMFERGGKPERFVEMLAEIKRRHGGKWRLMEQFEKRGW